MSDTPRTNNYIENFPGSRREPRLLDFARQLETELAEARTDLRLAKNIIETHVERVVERDKLIEQMRALIESEICKPCTTMRCDICKFQAALSAAERTEK